MARKVFVIGHKNPDTDSIVSAIAYAELLRRRGVDNVIAARQGDVWRETRYILERFGLALPALVEDVRPHARDVMTTDLVVASPDESAYCVGRQLRERSIRAMPLVDADRRLAGLITVEDFAHLLLTGLERDLVTSSPRYCRELLGLRWSQPTAFTPHRSVRADSIRFSTLTAAFTSRSISRPQSGQR